MAMLVKDILLTFLDFGIETFDIFDVRGYYKRPIKDYKKWRDKYRIKSEEIYRLKKMGLLKTDQKSFYLTKKGIRKLQRLNLDYLAITKPDRWDGKWRIVIFDIPEKNKVAREYFRKKLNELGFVLLQKSVFCYPYDCLEAITMIIKIYEIEPFVTFMEVTDIVTGKNLIKEFQNKGVF